MSGQKERVVGGYPERTYLRLSFQGDVGYMSDEEFDALDQKLDEETDTAEKFVPTDETPDSN